MKTITKKIHITETKDVDFFVTSDNKEFRHKDDAEKHQAQLDAIASFKKLINFKTVDIDITDEYKPGYHDQSFTFEIGDENPFLNPVNANHLSYTTAIVKTKNIDLKSLPKGKYLVIEYNDYDFSDRPSWDGYFGTVEDYLKWLDEKTKYIKEQLS